MDPVSNNCYFNLYDKSDDEKIKIFETVIKNNNWSLNDLIIARPNHENKYSLENSSQFSYKNGEIYNGLTYNIHNNSIMGKSDVNIVKVAGLNFLKDDDLKKFFEDLIRERKWNKYDVIIGKAYVLDKRYDITLFQEIKYHNGKISIEDFSVDVYMYM